MKSQVACQVLEWDSKFFGRRIARVDAAKLTNADALEVFSWARRESVDCVYLLVNADDRDSANAAQSVGFALTDIRTTLSRLPRPDDRDGYPGGKDIEPAKPDDIAALRAIARVSHRKTRFYSDPNFPRDRCDALYAKWIENSCSGDAQVVMVARQGGEAVGYLSCHLDAKRVGSIGLFAVSAEARGKAFGRRLLRASLEWFAGADAADVQVVTQGASAGGIRLYERAGFITRSVQLWYHLWPAARAIEENE
jgi:GNAT superfamily N-acetyltransferase